MIRRHSVISPHAQQGAAALIMLIILVLGASYLFVSELNRSSLQTERNKITAAALAQAKEAVLGYALANQRTPGGLAFPDRNGDGNYDGDGDCYTGAVSPGLLLGKLPSLNEDGCFPVVAAFNTTPLDAAGERIWFAASRNLFRGNSGNYPVITTTSLMATTNWLRVSDGNGTLLSNQVAFVLVAPGEVLHGQDRSSSAPNAQNFLDSFTVGAATYQNWNMANPLGFVTANAVNDATNRFNDRLLYVTRDEFMSRLVDRVAGEIRLVLTAYYTTIGAYPVALSDIVGSLPPWFNPNWTADTVYTRLAPGQVTIHFQGCPGAIFAITWNAATSDMRRNGTC